MANWGVALAQRPMVPRNRKKARHHLHNTPVHLVSSPSLLYGDAMPTEPPFRGHGNVFKNLCKPEQGAHDCYTNGCERIAINVSGLQFVTRRSILEAHPETLLGKSSKFLIFLQTTLSSKSVNYRFAPYFVQGRSSCRRVWDVLSRLPLNEQIYCIVPTCAYLHCTYIVPTEAYLHQTISLHSRIPLPQVSKTPSYNTT